MSIVSRYIFRQALSALLLILLSLAGVVWIALALKQLNLVTSTGSSALTLLALSSLALPNLLALIAPVALLIAAIHVLNRLNGDSELIILSASGGTIWQVARPLLLLALLVAIGVSLVNHVVMPWTLRELRTRVIELRTDLLNQVVQPGRFTAADGGKIVIHIRDRLPDGDLAGILMHDTRDPKQTMSYLAERGAVVSEGRQSFLVMRSGTVLRRAGPEAAPEILSFESYAIDLDGFDRKTDAQEWSARERYTSELLDPAVAKAGSLRLQGQSRAELHDRLSNPLYPFVFVLIALAFVGQSQSTRTNKVQATVAAVLAAVGVRLLGFAMNNVLVINAKMIPAMYALPVAALLVAVLAIHRNAHPRPRTGPLARLSDAISDTIAAWVQSFARRPESRPGRGRSRGREAQTQPGQ